MTYTDKDIYIVRADRYTRDFPVLQEYRNNEASPSVTNSFNLSSHKSYLDSVVDSCGITSRVMFGQEEGREFLKWRGVTDFTLYDDGWKTPLPRTTAGRFPNRANTTMERVMMGYRHPNGVIIKDDDKDGFRRTCLMGLWGLHSEQALV